VTADSAGHIWTASSDGGRYKVSEFSASGSPIAYFGARGTGNGQFEFPHDVAVDTKGNVWVTDFGNGRVEEFSSTGAFIRTIGSVGSENGHFVQPSGIAVDSAGNIWVGDAGNDRVQEFTSEGVFVRKVGFGGTGEGQFATSGPAPEDGMWLAFDSSGHLWVTDSGNNRVQEFSSTGTYMAKFGTAGTGNGQFNHPQGIAFDSSGRMFVADFGNNRIQEFTSTGAFIATFATRGSGEGQLSKPQGIGIAPNGDVWVGDMNNGRLEQYRLAAPSPLVDQTVYYSAAANSAYPSCGEHAEWANLPCITQPTGQPASGNRLPVVTDTYNVWDEPEVVVEAVGTTTRTKKSVYDSAGRLTGSEVTTNSGSMASLPTVTDAYDTVTGAMVKQSTTVGEKTQAITSVYNSLGQLTEYTDANGNKSTYAYDVDGRISEMNDGKGKQTYTYDPTTGSMTKLSDSAAGAFTAGYDVEGKLTNEKYPNGMTAKYLYNETDQPTHEEYVKETHCAEACVWFSEGVGYSVHGEALSRTSGLAGTSYTYDAAGRLTQAQETPAGKGCITRLYGYDADANRLSLTTREPAAGGGCATTGGTVESHTYDEADRMADPGVAYDAFGNTTTLPAIDAGGHEIKSSFYASSETHTTIQNGKTITYNLDPGARVDEVATEEGATKASVVNHFAGPGEAVSWSSEGGEKYTRDIPGIDGALSAVEQNGSTPVLQVHDLLGDIVATAALSESEAKLLSTYTSTEFGVPTTSNPPKYSWLGAAGVASEFASGTNASTGVGYVPQLGRPLQTQPITPPGAAPDGIYISPYISSISAADWEASAAYGAEAPMRQAAREQAAYEAAMAALEEEEAMREVEEEAETYVGKKPKAGKSTKPAQAHRANAGLVMELHHGNGYKGNACSGPGPYKCGEPGTGTKPAPHGGGGGGGHNIVHEWIEKGGEEIIGAKEQEYWDCIHLELCE
jgi:YD repeat-containing protein